MPCISLDTPMFKDYHRKFMQNLFNDFQAGIVNEDNFSYQYYHSRFREEVYDKCFYDESRERINNIDREKKRSFDYWNKE